MFVGRSAGNIWRAPLWTGGLLRQAIFYCGSIEQVAAAGAQAWYSTGNGLLAQPFGRNPKTPRQPVQGQEFIHRVIPSVGIAGLRPAGNAMNGRGSAVRYARAT
jgi:hypothetical protein